MNVLQILPELKTGGVERGTVDLARHLQKSGHRATVVSAGGPMVGDLTACGAKHFALPVHRKSPWSVWRCSRALAAILESEKIDVVHARSRVPALVAWLACRRAQVPLVTTCHGYYRRHPLSYVMGWGKIVIVASRIIGKRMRDDFGVPQRKLRLIHRGVNLDEFTWAPPRMPDRSAPVVGVIGRLTPIKGHPLFLKAMARVARVYPGLKIRIVGDASKPQYKEELAALVRSLGLSSNVEFLGTRYDIPALLSGMNVLCVPSVGEEAFGRTVIEAGACGVPVVATRMGGLIDILEDGHNGFLVSPDDPRELADAVLKLLKEPSLCRKVSEALRRKVESEFSLDRMFSQTLDVYREAVSRRRILVIKLSALGDVILSLPSLTSIRKVFPDAWISVLVGRKSRSIVRRSDAVDDVITFDEAARPRWANWWRMARILQREDFDCVVDLQNNRASHFLAYFSGARLRAGYANRKWDFFLNRRVPVPSSEVPPVEHQFEVLKRIGIDTFEPRLQLTPAESDARQIGEFLDAHWVAPSQTLVGINPGASPRWPTKKWPVENFARLCDELGRRNIRVVLTGSSDDAALAQELMAQTKNKPVNAVGRTTIPQLAALIRRCQVFVSSDSAPMHIAAAVNVPLIALFGPTDPRRHLVQPDRFQVFWKEVSCSPCYLRSCPIGHVCMKKITVQEVLDATLHFLGSAPAVLSAAAAPRS